MTQSASSPPVTVLVVDDEAAILDMLTMAVEDLGFTVYTAINGRDGLALAHQHKPALIVSDVMMPFVDGLALTREVKADPSLQATKIILVSAVNTIPANSGADAYLRKPFDLAELENTIHRILNS